MTFISTQTFDEQGNVYALSKISKEFTVNSDQEITGILQGKIRNKFETEPYTQDDVIPFPDLRSAEKHVLTELNVFWGMGSPPINHVPENARSAQRISNAMSSIATSSGRGTGNTVIYNPVFASAIEQAKFATKKQKTMVLGPNFENDQSDIIEQEVDIPFFESVEDIAWIEHPDAPTDKVLVLYRGIEDSDQPLIYVEGAGLILNDKLSSVENYGKFTKVK